MKQAHIWRNYYPKGAVDFFLAHHSEDNIMKDIERNRVFLCLDGSRNAVGTVTIKKNEISRLFVLPSYQGMGYGTEMISQNKQFLHSILKLCWTPHCRQKRYTRGEDIWMWNLIELLWEMHYPAPRQSPASFSRALGRVWLLAGIPLYERLFIICQSIL